MILLQSALSAHQSTSIPYIPVGRITPNISCWLYVFIEHLAHPRRYGSVLQIIRIYLADIHGLGSQQLVSATNAGLSPFRRISTCSHNALYNDPWILLSPQCDFSQRMTKQAAQKSRRYPFMHLDARRSQNPHTE